MSGKAASFSKKVKRRRSSVQGGTIYVPGIDTSAISLPVSKDSRDHADRNQGIFEKVPIKKYILQSVHMRYSN